MKVRNHLEGLDVMSKVVLKWILKQYNLRVLTLGVKWQAVVSTAMNVRLP